MAGGHGGTTGGVRGTVDEIGLGVGETCRNDTCGRVFSDDLSVWEDSLGEEER